MLQVFGVDEQEAVCVSRLRAGDQRERLTSQRSDTVDRGKPERMETEVHRKNHYLITNRYCYSVRTLSLTSCIILGPGSA